MVRISTEKRPGKARGTKSEKGFLDSYKEAPAEEVAGGVAFVLMDGKGIRHRGGKVHGETVRAEDSICGVGWGGGVGFEMDDYQHVLIPRISAMS